MNESQRRAWAALGMGPLWRLRAGRGLAYAGGREDAQARDEEGVGEDEGARDDEGVGGQEGVGRLEGMCVDDRELVPGGSRDAAASPADWSALRATVAECRACALARTRTRTVFGVGDERASWLFVGEAPGADEDRLGEPFVGRAGQLLDRMLAALGVSRERDVYIANILKCRPPGNRDPLPAERESCAAFLRQQIEWVRPRVIVALGRVAAQSLLASDAPLASLRGSVREYRLGDRAIPLVATYHPAYLLRTPADKARAWADLCLARKAKGEG